MRQVSFEATLINIPNDAEGAARILAQIGKPSNPQAGMKKLRDFLYLIEGRPAVNNRSREQVKNAVSSVWHQVCRAVEVGDWFDRMFAASPIGVNESAWLKGYKRPLTASLGGMDKQVAWKPYQPVAHMAAAFRIAMRESKRAQFFKAGAPRALQVAQIREIICDDRSWISTAVEQAEARMVMHRFYGRQAPSSTRMFVLTERLAKLPPLDAGIPPRA